MEQWLVGLAVLGAVGAGVIGGVFFAFSTFVMKALGRRPGGEGMGVMQAINVDVLNPWFLGVFMGTAAVCAAVGVLAVVRWERAGAGWLLAGAALYVVGTFGVTVACNVPLNERLARVEAGSAEGERVWGEYLRRWTAWNHVRTAAGVAGAAALGVGVRW
jgi:uncharacterized membrane protein